MPYDTCVRVRPMCAGDSLRHAWVAALRYASRRVAVLLCVRVAGCMCACCFIFPFFLCVTHTLVVRRFGSSWESCENE